MRQEKLRIMLAVPDLRDLGVQHDIRFLMKFWDRENFEPLMLLHRRSGEFADQFDDSMASIEVDDLILPIPRARVFLRIFGYARAFSRFRPHAVISFVPYSNLACIYARGMVRHRFGLAVSEHAHVSASMADSEAFSGPFLWFYRRRFSSLYNDSADLVKCIAEESRQDLIQNHGIRESKTRLIYNPVDFDEVRRLAREAPDHPWFLSDSPQIPTFINVGRLEAQKRQDLLLEAFARVRSKRHCRLAIVGRGSHLDRLRALAAKLGVSDDVAFLGFQRNPWRFMARATCLVLSSDWEGLPCVLTEAMCLRVPIVSTRCPSGPSEMLLHGKGGLLVPTRDVDAFSDAMDRVLDDRPSAEARAKAALPHLDRFDPRAVTAQYERLARELAFPGVTAACS